MGHVHAPARARMVGAATGLIALVAALLVGSMPASADPPYETEATITSVEFTADGTESGSYAEIHATWELEDNAAAPAGFVIRLPEELQGRVDEFPLVDPDGVELGQCTVTRTELFCDLDADYLAEHALDVSGDVTFWVRMDRQVETETEVTFTFGDVEATTTVTPNPSGPCTEDCEFGGRSNYKWGWYNPETDTIEWGVSISAPVEGMEDGLEVTVTDEVGPNQEIVRAYVVRSNEVAENDQGREVLVNWEELPESEYTVSDDLTTVTFTSDEGYFYEVRYDVEVTDGGASGDYTNAATVAVEGRETVPVEREVYSYGGSGSGLGTNVGRFAITKEVTGDAAAAEGVTFTGTYVVTPPEGEPIEGTFEVLDGETWTSPVFPRESTVVLTEVTPTEPETVTWGTPEFSESEFTIPSGETAAITLTNTATAITPSPSDVGSATLTPSASASPSDVGSATLTPSGESSTTGAPLPSTGADVNVGALVGALALVLLGGALLLMRRRQQG